MARSAAFAGDDTSAVGLAKSEAIHLKVGGAQRAFDQRGITASLRFS
jgi:hypothetical protein